MTVTLQINSPAEAQALMDHAKAAREAEHRAAPAPAPQINTGSTRAQAVYRDGEATFHASRGATKVQMHQQAVPQGFVRLACGAITSINGATAAGLIGTAVEWNSADIDTRQDAPKGAQANFKPGPSPAQAAAPSQAGQPNADSRPTIAVSEAERTQIVQAEEVISKATASIGATAVNSLQQDVVASGVLPSDLPQGVTQEMVDTLVGGYVTQANSVLRETGATVDALTDFLTENELRDARIAVFTSDDATLQQLGKKAVARLEKLPADPVLFKEMTAAWPKEVQVTQRDGVTWIKTPAWEMPWGQAVKARKISF